MSSKKKANKALLKQIEQRDAPLRALHAELFPEEYDELCDSIEEARARARGENPMSKEYQQKVNQRRLEMGVEPFCCASSGSPEGLISSWEYCREIVRKQGD